MSPSLFNHRIATMHSHRPVISQIPPTPRSGGEKRIIRMILQFAFRGSHYPYLRPQHDHPVGYCSSCIMSHYHRPFAFWGNIHIRHLFVIIPIGRYLNAQEVEVRWGCALKSQIPTQQCNANLSVGLYDREGSVMYHHAEEKYMHFTFLSVSIQ